MSKRPPQPGGIRASNNSGNIQARELASGELRYHARYRGKFLGSFQTRAEAERAIAAARDAYARTTEEPGR